DRERELGELRVCLHGVFVMRLDEGVRLAKRRVEAADGLTMRSRPGAGRGIDDGGSAVRHLRPIRQQLACTSLLDALREGLDRGVGINDSALERIGRLQESDLDISD